MLTEIDLFVLKAHIDLKAAYRRKNVINGHFGPIDRPIITNAQFDDSVDTLITQGYLKRNKIGSISVVKNK